MAGARHRAWLPSPELAVFAAATALYALAAASGVVWMDAGELSAAAFTLGGAHPPGHPVHTLLGKLAALAPIGEVGFRINLLSAASMGAALAGVVALARRLTPDRDAARAAGLVAAALAALSPPALVNATRAEVYAPTAALLVWALVAVLELGRAAERAAGAQREAGAEGEIDAGAEREAGAERALDAPGRRGQARLLLAAALACGVAAAIHPVIAAAAALPMAVSAVRAIGRRWRLYPLAFGLGALALCAYAYLPVRAAAPDRPLLLWGDPETARGFWSLVTGAAYQENFSPGGAVERFAGLWSLVGQSTGLGLLLGGLVGLGFGALTGLRGAGTALAAAVLVVAGASLQDKLNPDLPGYVLPALLILAAGLAPLLSAVLRLLPAELAGPGARGRRVAMVAVLVPVVAVGLTAGALPELDRGDDPTRLWAATVGAMPPGPAVYFASGDHALFADQYERVVAGARPDVAVASEELCRDEWFLRQLDRQHPELAVPYVDDGMRGALAERLALANLRAGRPVGGDLPVVGRPGSASATPRGRGFAFAAGKSASVAGPSGAMGAPASAAAEPGEVPAPLDFTGAIGRRVAARVGLVRAEHELGLARFAAAARAAGLAEALGPDRMAELAAARARADRPPLRPLLPAATRVLVHEPWMNELFADELAWRAGLERAEPPPDAPLERVLHARWRDLVAGRIAPGSAAILDLGPIAGAATTRLLVALGRAADVETHLRAIIARDPDDAAALALLASSLFNRGALAESEAMFRAAIARAPSVAETRARLSAVLAAQGKVEEARAERLRAEALLRGE